MIPALNLENEKGGGGRWSVIEKMGCDILFCLANSMMDVMVQRGCGALVLQNFTLLCDTILCNVCK